MDLSKLFKRKRAVSRNERAEKYSSKFNLRSEFSKGLAPRAALVGVFVLCGVFLLPPTQRTKEVDFKAGDIADRDIIAPFNFKVPTSQEELKIAKAQSALRVPPVYERDRQVERDLTNRLENLLDTLTVVVSLDTLIADEKMAFAATWLPGLSRGSLYVITDPAALKKLNKASREYQRSVFEQGLIDNASLIRRNDYREITIVEGNSERTRNVGDILDQGRLDEVIREEALARFGGNRERAQVFFELVRQHLLPNLVFDVEETNRRREAAQDQVRGFFEVSKNERIIGKHDKVTKDQERILQALERARADQETTRSPLVLLRLYAAEIIRLLLFCLLFGGYLYVFHRQIYRDISKLLAVFAVMLMYVVLMAVVVRFTMSPFLIPVAFASIMLAALFNYRLGLVTAVFASILIPLLTSYPATLAFVSLLAASLGVIGLERMKSRSHIYSLFLHVSVAYVVGIFSVELGQADDFRNIYSEGIWGVANGAFSAAVVVFLLPIFESLFSRTSRFTLLELTDLNKPILKRLNMEAHGTYHHSMLIGSLVDAVAPMIGADPLTTRVMAYYHDIGKMFKPEYFAENQEAGFNKHEKISPQMSSLILVSHVKDGVELAREEKLPELVIDGIREHHGTSVMSYFYQKALETDSHSSVKKDDFRYPGPRPRTKETGLLMCADTVEAAVRSLQDPAPAHIRNMVTKLIDAKGREGQLDESGLTLNDLNTIKEKFITILTGIYHKRIAYPGQDARHEEPGEPVVKSVQ